ncbi:MAG: AEC family transporter [Micrococcaceae bacterium]
MVEVLSGFTIVWVIILVGYIVGKTGVLGERGQPVLSRLAFFVASPALLFDTLSHADIQAVLGPQLWVAGLSALVVAGIYLGLSAWVLPRRRATEAVIAALGSSMVNSANLGLPIAAYVLGNAAYAAPVIIFQLAIYTPVYAFTMDVLTSRERAAAQPVSGPRKVGPTSVLRGTLRLVGTIARNPMILGSGAGLLVSVTGVQLLDPLAESIHLIGGASIPAMLIAFGMTLVGSRPLEKSSARRLDVALASLLKLVVHPVIAWVLAAFVFQLEGFDLLSAVVLGSLPTAQNVFVAASRYNAGLVVAKDTVLVTTVVAIPGMMAVAVLFS